MAVALLTIAAFLVALAIVLRSVAASLAAVRESLGDTTADSGRTRPLTEEVALELAQLQASLDERLVRRAPPGEGGPAPGAGGW